MYLLNLRKRRKVNNILNFSYFYEVVYFQERSQKKLGRDWEDNEGYIWEC